MTLAADQDLSMPLHNFSASPATVPDHFIGPFQAQGSAPPAIILQAVDEWLVTIENADWYKKMLSINEGKMFGVLVVQSEQGIRYLMAYSGKLNNSWELPGFVPPIFDVQTAEKQLAAVASQIAQLDSEIKKQQQSPERSCLETSLKDAREKAADELSAMNNKRQQRKAERQRRRQDNLVETNRGAMERQSQHDRAELKRLKNFWATQIAELEQRNEEFAQRLTSLEQQRKQLSQKAQLRHFGHYHLLNDLGQSETLPALFAPEAPPGGAGDCAAPKLLQFAYRHRFNPLALAEFWLGRSSVMGVRHHGHFYSPCRSRCASILEYMMPTEHANSQVVSVKNLSLEPEVVLEDDDVLVLNKPAGLLSTPGKTIHWSVYEWLRQTYPDATGALLVHRLDMDTSGLLLAAKSASMHKALQKQFIHRQIKKRYTALLDGEVLTDQGVVNLPLRVDLDDRPRQLVCRRHGKPAETHYQVIDREPDRVRVQFRPVTGRTHQLRVHAAHHQGLSAPIVGDPLYGFSDSRLHLHADQLEFVHPQHQHLVSVSSPVPF